MLKAAAIATAAPLFIDASHSSIRDGGGLSRDPMM
jgi:hypothetical protein